MVFTYYIDAGQGARFDYSACVTMTHQVEASDDCKTKNPGYFGGEHFTTTNSFTTCPTRPAATLSSRHGTSESSS
jgi:hypothetical protein